MLTRPIYRPRLPSLAVGLVGWWPLDRGLVDQSGNHGVGTLVSTPVPVGGITPSFYGGQRGAFGFTGLSQGIKVSGTKTVAGLNNWTISLWQSNTFPVAAGGGVAFYGERGTSGNDILKICTGDTASTTPLAAEVIIRDDAATILRVDGTILINDGKFHHLVATKSGTTVLLFTDSKPDGGSAGNWLGTNNFTDATLSSQIGTDNFNANLGSYVIDDVRLWNRALSLPEIKALYAEAFQPVIDIETIALMVKGPVGPTTRFRRTLSPFGTRTGSRQTQIWF